LQDDAFTLGDLAQKSGEVPLEFRDGHHFHGKSLLDVVKLSTFESYHIA
jgi:hypothetical protein